MQHDSSPRCVRSPSRARVLRILATAVLATAATSAQAQTITAIAPLAGDATSDARGVSANGTAVHAMSFGPSGGRTFRWSGPRGQEETGALPGSGWSWGAGISGNGQALLRVDTNTDSWFATSTRWTRARGLEDIGGFPGSLYGTMASGISFTGNEITGVATTAEGSYHAFRWTSGGMRDLGTLPGGSYSYGYAISGDGSVVYGVSDDATQSGDIATRWTASTGMQALSTVSPGDWVGVMSASFDGSVAAGYSGSSMALWRDGVVRDLGVLPGGSFAFAYAVSGDGRAVGGACGSYETFTFSACVWTERLGLVDLRTHLTALGVDLTGWNLDSVVGLSADGSTLVGAGTYQGEYRGWVVRVPTLEGPPGHAWGRPAAPNTSAHAHTTRAPLPPYVRRPR